MGVTLLAHFASHSGEAAIAMARASSRTDPLRMQSVADEDADYEQLSRQLFLTLATNLFTFFTVRLAARVIEPTNAAGYAAS